MAGLTLFCYDLLNLIDKRTREISCGCGYRWWSGAIRVIHREALLGYVE